MTYFVVICNIVKIANYFIDFRYRAIVMIACATKYAANAAVNNEQFTVCKD
jgi:hypothetical protein